MSRPGSAWGRATRRRLVGALGIPASVAGYWPAGAERWLLTAALLDGDRGRAAWARGRTALVTPDPSPGAAWLRPMLAPAVARHDPSDPLLPELTREHARAAARWERLVRHVGPVAGALAADGIPMLVLKGAALVTLGADPGRRPMGDVDLLVPRRAAERALDLAVAPPWRPQRPTGPAFVRAWNAAHLSDDDWCHIDLHWHLFWQDRRAEAEAGIWERASPGRLGEVAVLLPGRSDLLAHALMHGARRGRTSGIRWVADAWWLLHDGPIDWDVVLREGRARRMQARLAGTLGYLVAALDAPVPAEVLGSLHGSAGLVDRAEHAFQAREQGPLGALPEYLCAFARTGETQGGPRWRRFPGYLADAWDLPSPAAIPASALARARARLPGGGPAA